MKFFNNIRIFWTDGARRSPPWQGVRGTAQAVLRLRKIRYCLKNEGCILKEVQPSFRVLNAKLCHIYVARGILQRLDFLIMSRIMSHQTTIIFWMQRNGLSITFRLPKKQSASPDLTDAIAYALYFSETSTSSFLSRQWLPLKNAN